MNKFSFRDNPSVSDGRYSSVQLSFYQTKKEDSTGFGEIHNDWNVKAEAAMGPRNKNYISLYADVTHRIITMGTSRLFNPYLGIVFKAGVTKGELPLQKVFGLESALSRYAFASSFRTAGIYELLGDNFYSASVEYNFRDILFILLGVPSLHVDFVIRGATSSFWTNSHGLQNVILSRAIQYREFTIGLGRVADIFRIDFSYAKYHGRRFAVTLTSFL